MKLPKVVIIAEAGINHNGNLKSAFELVEAAASAKCDFVKIQTYVSENQAIVNSPKAQYQLTSNNDKTTQFQMLKHFELTKQDFMKIKKFCDLKKIGFLSTGFDIESVKFLMSIKQKMIKIPSGEITNFPLLKFISKHNKKTILSTGMSTYKEIDSAVDYLRKNGLNKKNLILLHCTSAYPAPLNEINLKVLNSFKIRYGLSIGYSDHSSGFEVAIAAVALGASIIEKHFTLDKRLKGPDHQMSLEPQELSKFVQNIRNTEIALGISNKIVTKSEKANLKVVRKSIVAKTFIKRGELFTEHNLTTKRPFYGISPINWDKLIGKKSKKDYRKDDFILDET